MPAKKKEEEVAAYNWDSYEGGTGLENLTSKDLGIPILQIVQKGSPEFDEDHPEHASKKIPGCKVGDIFNTVTRELLFSMEKGQPIKVVPYYYSGIVYVEWRPRESGGGVVQTHTSPDILSQCTRDEKTSRDILPNGNIISTTAYFFVHVLHEDREPEDCLIVMTSTQLKKARAWLNMMKNFRAGNGNSLPMFHRGYFLSTVGESNNKGNWRGWKIEAAPTALSDPDTINALIKLAQSVHQDAQALIGTSTQGQLGDQDIL